MAISKIKHTGNYTWSQYISYSTPITITIRSLTSETKIFIRVASYNNGAPYVGVIDMATPQWVGTAQADTPIVTKNADDTVSFAVRNWTGLVELESSRPFEVTVS